MWFVKNKPLQVALMEQEVVVVNRNTPRGVSTSVLPTGMAPGHAGQRWAPALETLGQWLQDHPLKGTALQVQLSAQLVRWQCLPWPEGLVQPAALQAYAQARMRANFGAPAEQWQVLVRSPRAGQSLVACAIDQSLLLALQELAKTHQLKLRDVAPYFATAHDHWQRHLNKGLLWFVALEPSALTLGLLQQGKFMGLRSARLASNHPGGWQEVVLALQRQMRISAGMEVAQDLPVWVSGAVPEGQTPAEGHTHLLATRRTLAAALPVARMACGV